MNRDKNACGAPMVRRVRELGWPATQAAEAAGVSARTVRKNGSPLTIAEGDRLLDRSSRPRNLAERLSRARVRR